MAIDSTSTDIPSRLLAAAIRLLEKSGPTAVKARQVAIEAGVSTMGVYDYFGGVPGLLQAVAGEGYSRLTAVLKNIVETDNPMTDLCMMAFAIRDFSVENTHFYDLMKEPSASHKESYLLLQRSCVRLATDNSVIQVDPDLIALQFWIALHGFINLEFGGYFADKTNPVREVLIPMCITLVVGMGIKTKSVESSVKRAMSKWQQSKQPRNLDLF